MTRLKIPHSILKNEEESSTTLDASSPGLSRGHALATFSEDNLAK